MADLLERSLAWLEQQRNKYMSRVVVYQRGTESVQLSATIGRTVFEQTGDAGAIVQFEARDFLVLANHLVLGGQNVLPERGDRIREMQDYKTFVYEVLAPGKEPCWRYSDPFRKTLRIHTKQIAMEDS